MIPAAFDYEVAESVDHAIDLLAADGDAKPLAGGHSLVPAMKLRAVRPSKLVDIGRLDDLAYVRDAGDHVAIGALTRYVDIVGDATLRSSCPLVPHTTAMIGDPQVRERGTIGGSLAHGDPASDLPTVMLALGARMVVRGKDGEREVPAGEFFEGVFQTAVRGGELLTEVKVPHTGPSTGWSYLKMRRRAQDWATVGVAAVVMRDGDGVLGAGVALTNMGATPLRAAATEAAIASGRTVVEAAEEAAEGTEPSDDTSASADFRRHLARVLTRRALEEAVAR
jgi:aerobic carbon-monoxide dehydrogenase medium subunit